MPQNRPRSAHSAIYHCAFREMIYYSTVVFSSLECIFVAVPGCFFCFFFPPPFFSPPPPPRRRRALMARRVSFSSFARKREFSSADSRNRSSFYFPSSSICLSPVFHSILLPLLPSPTPPSMFKLIFLLKSLCESSLALSDNYKARRIASAYEEGRNGNSFAKRFH